MPIGYDRHKSGRPDHVNLLFVSQLSLKSARDTLIPIAAFIPSFSPDFDIHFRGKKVDRYRYRYEINPTVSHFYSNESIGFLWRSIDRSIDYAPERVKLAEGPFNSGKWLDRNNWSHPTDRCNLFDYRWSRWPMYKSAASFPRNFARVRIHRFAVFSIGSNRWIVRASSISSERKCCVGHDTR